MPSSSLGGTQFNACQSLELAAPKAESFHVEFLTFVRYITLPVKVVSGLVAPRCGAVGFINRGKRLASSNNVDTIRSTVAYNLISTIKYPVRKRMYAGQWRVML